MAANRSWARWIKASVSKHFVDAIDGEYPVFIENQHRDTSEFPEFLELRVDGPRLREVSKDCWKLRVEINVLCQAVMNETDYHVIEDMVGLSQSALVAQIPVHQYGNRSGDDNAFLGCLVLLQASESRDYLEANRFGQIDTRTKLLQSAVEGHYVMDLDTQE